MNELPRSLRNAFDCGLVDYREKRLGEQEGNVTCIEWRDRTFFTVESYLGLKILNHAPLIYPFVCTRPDLHVVPL